MGFIAHLLTRCKKLNFSTFSGFSGTFRVQMRQESGSYDAFAQESLDLGRDHSVLSSGELKTAIFRKGYSIRRNQTEVIQKVY
jgi:hypothetical protein